MKLLSSQYWIAVCSVCLVSWHAPTNAQQLVCDVFDNFGDGDLDDWRPNDNMLNAPWGPGIYSARDGVFRMESTDEIPGGTPGPSTSLFAWWSPTDWSHSIGGPDLRNGVLRGKVRTDEEGGTATLVLRGTGLGRSYMFMADSDTGEFRIGSLRGFSLSIHSTGDDDVTFGVGEDWWLEAATVDNRMSLKYWKDGEMPPATPQVAFLDDEPILDDLSEVSIGGWKSSESEFDAKLHIAFDELCFRHIDHWISGDFSMNDLVDAADIDALSNSIRTSRDPFFDVNQDNLVDTTDRDVLVHQLLNTWFGDANLDGEFNSGDFVQVFEAGKFETGKAANWSEGDWSGDGVFDSGDFVIAFQDGGYEQGPRIAVSTVPEPSPIFPCLLCLIALLKKRKTS